ncbi:hypothetical protein [Rhodoferax sp.]
MKQRSGKYLAYAAALTVLASVFTLYAQPDFLVRLADQMWSCF